jgi:hypothetical protein
MQDRDLWDVIPCSSEVSWRLGASYFDSEGGGDVFLRNVAVSLRYNAEYRTLHNDRLLLWLQVCL